MTTAVAARGLEGIVAANSGICWIDGDAGVLAYRGIDIHELAERSSFEETCYLLWFGTLPTATQLADFRKNLVAARTLPHGDSSPARISAEKWHADGSAAHRRLCARFYDPDEKDNTHDANVRKSYRLTSQIAHDRGLLRPHSQGQAAGRCRPHAFARRQLPVDAEWREALAHRGKSLRHGADSARRPRTECLHLCRARHRGDALRYSLGHHRSHRRAERPAARRSQ